MRILGNTPFILIERGRLLRERWAGVRVSKSILTGLIEPTDGRLALKGLFATVLLLSAALVAALSYQVGARVAAREELAQRQREVQRFEGEALRATTGSGIASQLPPRADAGVLLVRVQHLAVENSVTLVSLSASKDTPTNVTAGLRRESWDMQLSGDYVAVKNLLGTLLERSPEIWLTRLHMKATGIGVDAQLTLQAWTLDAPAYQPRVEVKR